MYLCEFMGRRREVDGFFSERLDVLTGCTVGRFHPISLIVRASLPGVTRVVCAIYLLLLVHEDASDLCAVVLRVCCVCSCGGTFSAMTAQCPHTDISKYNGMRYKLGRKVLNTHAASPRGVATPKSATSQRTCV